MYLGQESWGQQASYGGQGMGQQIVQPRQVQPNMMQGGAQEVGAAVHVSFVGCVNDVVGPIIRGDYTRFCVNHGKPAFKKQASPGGMEVMIYFWDERDGPAASGWWLGPKLGSDHVWGFHPNKAARTPPTTGWQVPHSGPADPTCILRVKGPQQQQPQPQQQQWGQQQQPQQNWQQQQQQKQQAAQQAAQKAAQLKQQQMQQQQMLQKQRMEQVKKQQEELRIKQEEQKKKQEEQKKKQAEELAVKRKEQAAVAAIRQKLMKLKTASPDNFEAHLKEFEEVQAKEMANCGSQAATMQTEGEKGVEAARERLKQLEERKIKNEALMKENEEKRKKAAAVAEERNGELEQLVGKAEAASTKLTEAVAKLTDDADITAKKLAAATKAIETATEAAAEEVKGCAEFLTAKTAELAPGGIVMAPEVRQSTQKLRSRLEEVKKANNMAAGKLRSGQQVAEKKIAAKLVTSKADALFTKYDKDKDGSLSKDELLAYASGEFKFTIPGDTAAAIVKNLSGGAKGVKKDLFQKLKVQVGIAREAAKDVVRKQERLAKEKRLEELKEALQVKIDAAEKTVGETEELVVAAEKEAVPLVGVKTSSAIMAHVSGIEAAVEKAKVSVTASKETVEALSEGVDADLAVWLGIKVKKLDAKLGKMDPRLTKATSTVGRLQAEGKRRDTAEVGAFEKRALATIKYHQKAKTLSNDDVLAAISKKDKIAPDEFVKFVQGCEKEPTKEGAEETAELSADDLKRVFAHLDEASAGSLSKDSFLNFIRVYMKVTVATAITSEISIKDSKSLRRLEVGEVVEILEGPTKEDSVDVMRVRARTVTDNIDGWITTEGNKGTSFLAEGGSLWRVVKETILTGDFDLDGENKESRKLKVGEILEVREWAKKEEKSGLMRMKCRCKSDGMVGYVTTVGNTGTVFVEVV